MTPRAPADVRSRFARSTLGRAGALALVVVVTGCASVPELPAGPFTGASGDYTLAVPRWMLPLGPDDTFEMIYRDRDNTLFVGLVVDRPPRPLDELDALIERNLKGAGYDGARILETGDAELGGLPARRRTVHIVTGDRTFLMINTYTATARENVQLIVWGASSVAHQVRAVADELARTGLTFADSVVPFVTQARHRLDAPELPFRFPVPPRGWMPARRDALKPGAVLELEHPEGGFFFVGLADDETPAREAGPPSFDDVVAQTTAELDALFDPGAPRSGVTDADGGAPDQRWNMAGVLAREQVHVTYRVRVVRIGARYVRLFCWGETGTAGLDEACRTVVDETEARQVGARRD